MFHTLEGAAHLLNGLQGHPAPHGGNGSQQVLHVVQAAQLHLAVSQHRGHHSVLRHAQHIVLLVQEGTIVGVMQAGKPHLLALAVGLHAAAHIVLVPQHGTAGGLLPQQDVPLGVDVLGHILVVIQMVGGHIGNHSHIGALVHTDQLEAGQLHNRLIFGLHLTQNGQQRAADVAAQMHGAARRLKHGGNQAGGGGFAVAAGHGDLFAGAVLEEQLHLAAQLGAVLMGLLQGRGVELKAGGSHDDVLPLKTVHVVLAQAQANA